MYGRCPDLYEAATPHEGRESAIDPNNSLRGKSFQKHAICRLACRAGEPLALRRFPPFARRTRAAALVRGALEGLLTPTVRNPNKP